MTAQGIRNPREKAENVILLGCNHPFVDPILLRPCLRLLERLGIEYTYLDREFCCGLPMVMIAKEAEKGKVL